MEAREEKLCEAIRAAQRVLADQVLPDPERTPEEAIDELLGILDDGELIETMERSSTPAAEITSQFRK